MRVPAHKFFPALREAILEAQEQNKTFDDIANILQAHLGVKVSPMAVWRIAKSRTKKPGNFILRKALGLEMYSENRIHRLSTNELRWMLQNRTDV